MSNTNTSTLAQQLLTLQGELLADVLATTHSSVIQAVTNTLTQTEAPTVALAQAAVAPIVGKLPAPLQVGADEYIASAAQNAFNWLIGAIGGSSAKSVAEASEATSIALPPTS
jgi:hypothetical protein